MDSVLKRAFRIDQRSKIRGSFEVDLSAHSLRPNCQKLRAGCTAIRGCTVIASLGWSSSSVFVVFVDFKNAKWLSRCSSNPSLGRRDCKCSVYRASKVN